MGFIKITLLWMFPHCSFLNLRVLIWNSIVLIWQLWKWQLITFRGSVPSPDCVACALEISSVPFKTRHMLTEWGRAIGDLIKRRWGNSFLNNISFCLSHYGYKMIRNKTPEATELNFWIKFLKLNCYMLQRIRIQFMYIKGTFETIYLNFSEFVIYFQFSSNRLFFPIQHFFSIQQIHLMKIG